MRKLKSHNNIKQQGAALLIFLIILILAGLVFLVQWTPKPAEQIDAKTQATMNQVKQALIAYAARRDARLTARPGELPCPDPYDLLDAKSGTAHGTDCNSYEVGRVPWRTLGIPKPVDASGEVLWYVLDKDFRYNNPGKPINTASQAKMRVLGDDGSRVLAGAVVAVIFAANSPIAKQKRGQDVALCVVRNKVIPQNACPDNYLDSQSGVHNGQSTNGQFIQGVIRGTRGEAGQAQTPFNDRLMWITAEDLMPSVEQRVLANAREALSTLPSKPFPANPNATTYASDSSRCTGLLPQTVLDTMPSWFKNNHWEQHIGYALAGVAGCPAFYTLPDGRQATQLVFGHGAARSGQTGDFVYFLESNQRIFVDNAQFVEWVHRPDLSNDQALGWEAK